MKILAIIGSTRPTRIGAQITDFVKQHAAAQGAEIEIADLKAIDLPFLDEPKPARSGEYTQEHTKAWSEVADSADIIVAITPEYNGGYPAPLKNAIDYLWNEWQNKPAGIISYGFGGGARAYDQLEQVLSAVNLRVDEQGVKLQFGQDDFNADGTLVDPENTFAEFTESLEGLVQRLIAAVAE